MSLPPLSPTLSIHYYNSQFWKSSAFPAAMHCQRPVSSISCRSLGCFVGWLAQDWFYWLVSSRALDSRQIKSARFLFLDQSSWPSKARPGSTHFNGTNITWSPCPGPLPFCRGTFIVAEEIPRRVLLALTSCCSCIKSAFTERRSLWYPWWSCG